MNQAESILQFTLKQICPIVRDICLKYFRSNFSTTIKSDNTIVTIADREIELFVKQIINKHFPEHSFLGEETGLQNNNHEYLWVIDPIDGTTSFASGRASFCFLLTLFKVDTQIFSLCYQPILNEVFYSIGEYSYLNGAIIKSSSRQNLQDCYIASCSPRYITNPRSKDFFSELESFCRASIYGGDAYLYCQLAMGGLDIVFDEGLAIYDIAPLVLLIKNSGCKIKTLDFQDFRLVNMSIQNSYKNSDRFGIIAYNYAIEKQVEAIAAKYIG